MKKNLLMTICSMILSVVSCDSGVKEITYNNQYDPDGIAYYKTVESESVQTDKGSLDIAYGGTDSSGSITQNITLATTGPNGTTITWLSSNSTIIAINGTVTRPAYGTGNTTVTLTATISKGSTFDTKIFIITIIQAPSTDAGSVAADKSALVITYGSGDSSASVTQNVTLPTAGSSGTTIAWGSSNTGIIAANGAVTRPAYGSGNASITMTATISKGLSNDTKQFILTVIENPQSDAGSVAADKAALVIIYGGSDSAGNVTQNVTLQTVGSSGTTISWSSSNTGVISNAGIVTRPAYGSGNASSTITATITKGLANDTKQFVLTVLESPQTDAGAVAADKTALVIIYGGSDSAGSVTQNVTLAIAGSSGTTISWVSSNTAVISNSGVVTRPVSGSGNASSTLTATISKGLANDTKMFILTVLQNSGIPRNGLVAEYLFNGDASDSSGSGNHGQLGTASGTDASDPALTTDRFGNTSSAYNFDGLDDYIQSDWTSISISSFTISVWINTSEIANSNFRYFSDFRSYYYLAVQNGKVVGPGHWDFPNAWEESTMSVNDGVWHHVILVYDESTRKAKLYINNTFQWELLSSVSRTFNATLYDIGERNRDLTPGTDKSFYGKIDDVRIYNRALSASEIQALYNEPNTISWAKTYGGSLADAGEFIMQNADSSYLIGGGTYSFGAGDEDGWLIKTDLNGNILWEKAFGGTGQEYFTSIVSTSNNGSLIAGSTNYYGAGLTDILLIKLDSSGNIIWQKAYGGANHDGVYKIIKTSDDGYILGGLTASFGVGGGYYGNDGLIIKIDNDGNILWAKAYGINSGSESIRDIKETSDNNLIVTGYYNAGGSGPEWEQWVLKLDSNGNVLWEKALGFSSSADTGQSIEESPDGKYLALSSSNNPGTGNQDYWVTKFDTNGTVLWQKAYGGANADYPGGMVKDNSGLILFGTTGSFSANADLWFIKIDYDGSIIWQKRYDSSSLESVSQLPSMTITNDGGIIVNGQTQGFGAGGWDNWIIKTKSDGSCPPFGTTTNATVTDTSATITTTSATVTNITTMTTTTTTVTVTNTNATVNTQSP